MIFYQNGQLGLKAFKHDIMLNWAFAGQRSLLFIFFREHLRRCISELKCLKIGAEEHLPQWDNRLSGQVIG